MLTREDLLFIVPYSKKKVDQVLDPLNAAMDEFEINTPERQSAFLAQIAHESGSFVYVKELASGHEYDVGKKAIDLGNTPEDDGDGEKYKGRGWIQITGTNNYRDCGEALGLDLLAEPELLEQMENAARSAGWFWSRHGCNELADSGDFERITKRINGGLNGYADRLSFWERAKQRVFAS